MTAHPNLTLQTRARVEKLLTDSSGHTVTGVLAAMGDGSSRTCSGDVVVLSAGSILSAVLLLRSATDRHPGGLGNSSDVVGRHYMRHNNLALMAFSENRNPTVFQKTLSINDYYGPSQEPVPAQGHDVSATAHQAGTVRFGADPTSSALDVDCKAHDLDNLYVVDGSFMPSIGAVNPTLTIIANAIRVAEHIAQRLAAA